MRETTAWHQPWAAQLTAHSASGTYPTLPMAADRLLDIELVLTALVDYLPGVDPEHAWICLNGYDFPAWDTYPAAARQAFAIMRQRLATPALGRWAWQGLLRQYRELPDPWPLYRIEGTTIRPVADALLAGRADALRTALTGAPPLTRRAPRYAVAGRYRFYAGRDSYEVTIPAGIATPDPPRLPAPTRGRRPPLTVPWADLLATADWMDTHAPPGSAAARAWGARMRGMELCAVGTSGLAELPALTLDGLLHLVGTVGSGKSTLFIVLAVCLARQGYRVMLVQGDVASLLDLQEVFAALAPVDPQLVAVPLIGRSTRPEHLNRLHRTEALEGASPFGRPHPGYAALSTACALDGLRPDGPPIPPGQEPCTRLYRRPSPESEAALLDPEGATPAPDADGEERTERRYDCPFLSRCPVHFPTRALATTNLWLATPASLVVSGPLVPLVREDLRAIEWIMRHADVVLIDEADRVQTQLDERFAPTEVLVGGATPWLDQLAASVPRQVYQPGRAMVGRHGIDRFLTAHNTTQRTIDVLYARIRESAAIRQWLGYDNPYFSGQRLLQRVAEELADAGLSATEQAAFAQAQERFPRTPQDLDTEPQTWGQALYRAYQEDPGGARALLQAWVGARLPAGVSRPEIDRLADHLLIALIVVVLDHSLQDLLAEWPAASKLLDLDRGSGGMFYRPSNDLVRLLPEAPMGAVLGFQYYDPGRTGDGELRFFHARGVGRSLLYRLPTALTRIDGIPGPHTVLASATSWAPGSWRYDLHVPPQVLLRPYRPTDPSAPPRVACFLDQVPDPEQGGGALVTVSGRQGAARTQALHTLVRELATSPGMDYPSRLDQELATLDPTRQRILLVVGSYAEVQEASATLAEALGPARAGEVVAVVPETDDEDADLPGTLRRSLLATFPERPEARFLVAPLLAIERGHNILVGSVAAIGSVFFLVRPFPAPGDPHAAIGRLNYWALNRVPTLIAPDLVAAGLALREEAHQHWDQALLRDERYSRTPPEELSGLLWTQLVLVWQCIGRLLRGGVQARVFFVDGKWTESTESTPSMLAGFRRILQAALADPDPSTRVLARELYGDLADALMDMKGLLDA